jgi:hypothetical protein
MSNNLTIFVNTSDGFEDCWIPFFQLFTKHWPSCKYQILLNTEFKEFSFEGLNIKCTKVHEEFKNRKLTWSECFLLGLEQVVTPYVLYLQEDYFFETPVRLDIIDSFLKKMEGDTSIKYIGLTDIGNYPPFKDFIEDNRLVEVGNGKYRISTQAALWDKQILLSYILPHENGWMFEIFGTERAKKRSDRFLTANRNIFSRKNNPILSYEHTGIIKGRWHPSMEPLFKKNNIDVNFELRGFYKSKPYLLRKIETMFKLLKNPFSFINSMIKR